MDPYNEMYLRLFNKLSHILEEIQQVQQETEELFISQQVDPEGDAPAP